MGRILKRVPLDFNYPIDQLWKGYINPFSSQECGACKGTALNAATKKLSDDWYSMNDEKWIYIKDKKRNNLQSKRYNDNAWMYHLTEVEIEALVKAGRLWEFMPERCIFKEEENKWYALVERGKPQKKEIDSPVMPTPEMVNDRAKNHGMLHDTINRYICVEARAKKLGVYGHCEHCDEGRIWASQEIKKLHDEWEKFDPPTGDGYQLWNTTTEGHPMTPVFATLEELAQYCEDAEMSWFGDKTATREDWFNGLSNNDVHVQMGNMIFL